MTYDVYLAHHGILGMKWGVRRYQNADGTLTAAGRKRYENMSDVRLSRDLKKQIQSRRGELKGSGNKWTRMTPIGEKSEKLIRERDELEEKYRKSQSYKDWEKKIDSLNRDLNSGKITVREYDKASKELHKEKPKRDFNTLHFAKVINGIGNPPNYIDNFINKGGKDLSVAYLMDLGYNEETALEFVRRISRAKRTLADS